MYFALCLRFSAIRFFTLSLFSLFFLSGKSFGLDYQYGLLKDVPVEVSLTQLLLKPEQYSFAPSDKIYGAGYSQQASWVRLRFSKSLSGSDEQWYIQFYAPAQKQVFFRDLQGNWQSKELTLSQPLHLDTFLSFKQTLHLNPVLSDYQDIYIKTVDKGPHSMGSAHSQKRHLAKNRICGKSVLGSNDIFRFACRPDSPGRMAIQHEFHVLLLRLFVFCRGNLGCVAIAIYQTVLIRCV